MKAKVTPWAKLGRATGIEPVVSCATDRRLNRSATLATYPYNTKPRARWQGAIWESAPQLPPESRARQE